MVEISDPPPRGNVSPRWHRLTAGDSLTRIYRTKHGSGAYKHLGPHGRFDHHRAYGEPAFDAERGVYYAAFDLAGCLVEVFGDTRMVELSGYGAAIVEVGSDVELLDLRGDGAWAAGSVAALTKESDRAYSQRWARYFYETFPLLGGLLYETPTTQGRRWCCSSELGRCESWVRWPSGIRTCVPPCWTQWSLGAWCWLRPEPLVLRCWA